MPIRSLYSSLAALWLAAGLLAGCTVTPKPPLFSLYDHQGLTVLPFDNLTQDRGLGAEFQDEILGQLLRLNALPIAEEGQVADYLRELGDTSSIEHDAKLRSSVAAHFNADVIMIGSLTAYVESETAGTPRRIKVSYNSENYKWGYYRTKQVKVTATIKLVDAESGRLLWVKRGTGAGTTQTWVDLPYAGTYETPPAQGWTTLIAAAETGDDGPNGHGHGQGRGHERHDQAPNQPVININITNTNTQSQSATATAAATAQSSEGPLLYQSDPAFAALRTRAIHSAATQIVRDFQGRGGWTPEMAELQP